MDRGAIPTLLAHELARIYMLGGGRVMKLYHGTSERHVKAILKEGIKPRGRGTSNWKTTVESNPDAVYLTNAYPLHFAGAAVRGDERLAVIEVNTRELFILNLMPDEDFLEQFTRREGPAPVDKSMKYRTRWYRKRARDFQHYWLKSVDGLGTCCHLGTVPVSALMRVVYMDQATFGKLIVHGCDPMIHLLNYRLVGAKYRNYTHWLFNDPLEDDPEYGSRFKASLDKFGRDGIILQELPSKVIS